MHANAGDAHCSTCCSQLMSESPAKSLKVSLNCPVWLGKVSNQRVVTHVEDDLSLGHDALPPRDETVVEVPQSGHCPPQSAPGRTGC